MGGPPTLSPGRCDWGTGTIIGLRAVRGENRKRWVPTLPIHWRVVECLGGLEAMAIIPVAPNATFRVGADGETGDFKGLTLFNSSPVLLGGRGIFFDSRPRHDWSFANHPRCRRFVWPRRSRPSPPTAGVVPSPRAVTLLRARCCAAAEQRGARVSSETRLQRVCYRRRGFTATSRRCGGWANIKALFQKTEEAT